ncbi:MAG: hypothetical protein PHV12_04385, partial [Bacteroidales bacterium]|nr:hypothetical protein [Bacteroidales bacterium]
RVARITEGVSATANEMRHSERNERGGKTPEVVRISSERSKIAIYKLKESPPQRTKCATANAESEEEKLRKLC